MQMKTSMKYHFIPSELARVKQWKMTSAGKVVRKLDLCALLVEMWNIAATVENSMTVTPKLDTFTIWPSSSTPRCISQKTENKYSNPHLYMKCL
jgi:hypothetical protein